MTSTCNHFLSGGDEDYFEQREQVEWEIVNKLLQHHGFNPIHFADPQTKNFTDVILLGKQSGIEIRHVVATLISDTERRQALIRDLIQSNNELKNDVRQQQSKASRYEQRASDLEHIVEDFKGKFQELQSDYLAKDSQQKNLIEQLKREKQDSKVHHQQLKQKLHEQEDTILQLQEKLYMVVTEEEQRIERRNKIFHKLRKRVPKAHSGFDQQLLDLIDFYEMQNHRTQQDWRKDEANETARKRKDHSGNKVKNKYLVEDTIPNHKTLVKAYEDHLQESRAKNEKVLQKQWNYKFSGNGRGDDEIQGKSDSLKIEDVDYIQGSDCRQFPKNICKEIEVQDVSNLVPTVCQRLRLGATCPKLQKESKQTLEDIVSHFQKLFDVTSLSGVYPRMNEVYSKLGEISNAMRSLKQLLGLDDSTSPHVLVNKIGKLCSSINEDASRQVQYLLGTQDINSIINKLEEHEEFFPAFYALMQELLQILEIDSLDYVVPTVRALKLQ